uniref:BZIP domain-containing protein n=1 Tax=Ditylum brightwellii TaxID=49249 RepID=A0A7S1ZK33_9STRA|mmetsp:Transcript_3332/g.5054  ORF Transcript_3332/g.5054 Transcript_3332/m.5054 type:complete len:234 (+) Transcript_3332:135-836(+)
MAAKEDPKTGATSYGGVQNTGSSLARKKRKEIMSSHRSAHRNHIENDHAVIDMTGTSSPPTKKWKGKIQKRYEPEAPMTKEEIIAWRKTARKQRNRESAAASRQKVRDRIVELENEVDGWKSRYASALETIRRLESLRHMPLQYSLGGEGHAEIEDEHFPRSCAVALNSYVDESPQRTNTAPGTVVSPCSSPLLSPNQFTLQPPPLATSYRNQERDHWMDNNQHVIEMISRQA